MKILFRNYRYSPGVRGGGGSIYYTGRDVPRKWVCFSHPLLFGLVVKVNFGICMIRNLLSLVYGR